MAMTITAIQDSFPGMDHSRDYTLSIFHKDLLSVHLPLAPLKPILLEDLSDKSSVTFFTLSWYSNSTIVTLSPSSPWRQFWLIITTQHHASGANNEQLLASEHITAITTRVPVQRTSNWNVQLLRACARCLRKVGYSMYILVRCTCVLLPRVEITRERLKLHSLVFMWAEEGERVVFARFWGHWRCGLGSGVLFGISRDFSIKINK